MVIHHSQHLTNSEQNLTGNRKKLENPQQQFLQLTYWSVRDWTGVLVAKSIGKREKNADSGSQT